MASPGMNPQDEADNRHLMAIYRQKRIFDKEKLAYANYIQKFFNGQIEDVLLLSRSIFILLSRDDFSRVENKNEIISYLNILLDKLVFIIPTRSDLVELMNITFGSEFIEHVDASISRSRILVAIILNVEKKKLFFKKYKKITCDLTFLLENLLSQRIYLTIS